MPMHACLTHPIMVQRTGQERPFTIFTQISTRSLSLPSIRLHCNTNSATAHKIHYNNTKISTQVVADMNSNFK